MPATTADIFAGSRDVAIATWESATIAARYPNARDASVQPSIGYFDAIADAQAVMDARGAIIGVERRRFVAISHAVSWPTISTGIPQAQLIDTENRADGAFLVARIEVDLEAETTTHELFG